MEPLLKEEKEKIVFRKKKKTVKTSGLKSCLTKSVILTLILTVAIFYYFGRTAYGFYLGFKYFDLRYQVVDTTTIEK